VPGDYFDYYADVKAKHVAYWPEPTIAVLQQFGSDWRNSEQSGGSRPLRRHGEKLHQHRDRGERHAAQAAPAGRSDCGSLG
jgi:hypothetical protein